ncbi:Cupredoxin [Usnea florida]
MKQTARTRSIGGKPIQLTYTGNSVLGTSKAPTLALFLPQPGAKNGVPSSLPQNETVATAADPYGEDAPITNVTRKYNFTISRGYLRPDGFNKSVILIDGGQGPSFPGPMIEANWGDTFEITVHNQIKSAAEEENTILHEEGTSIHWHGMLQKHNESILGGAVGPWFDGVPSVDQCPIAPGSSFTYRFIANPYGTSWYHSHYSAQYADGLFGAMIIHGPNLTLSAGADESSPKDALYDVDLGPVILSDWYHNTSESIVASQEAPVPHQPIGIPVPDNNLINGKNNFNCSLERETTRQAGCNSTAGISKFYFTSGKVHRLRLINAGGEALQRFTIDNHNITIVANDLVPVVPYQPPYNMVTLGAGQRTDILVTANGSSTDAVYMRSDISATCVNDDLTHSQTQALAAIYYEKADVNKTPISTGKYYNDSGCHNDDLSMTVPLFPFPAVNDSVNSTDLLHIDLHIDFHLNSTDRKTGSLQWFMNNSTFHANYNHPVLFEANRGNFSYPDDPQWNVYNTGTAANVRINMTNFVPNPHASHPMHLHGHNFFVLSEGPGIWNGQSGNFHNPPRRDTHILRQGDVNNGSVSHLVVQFKTDNPGVWPLHCHRAWHVSSGLYINLLERPDDIAELTIPGIMAETCTNWDTYSNSVVVDQIDSGLKL